MKKMLFSVFLMLFMGSYGTVQTVATTVSPNPKSISLHLVRIQDEILETPTSPVGRRSNRLPITGEISLAGVNIPGVENSEILSYEIYDSSAICMGMYADEMEFVNALFSLSGEFEIKFVTEETTFIGMVEV